VLVLAIAATSGHGRVGTPDLLRLDDARDRDVFRRWFAFLAEVQYFSPAAERPGEIVDCAALVRYAYREALRRHDTEWATSAHLPVVPAFDSVRKYNFPRTPVGPALFRLDGGAFGQFADAETLQRFNTFFLARHMQGAQRGDLIFFRRVNGRVTFHTMIFIGASQVAPNGVSYVVYHTGPDGGAAGEIRRLAINELLRYPDPEWRPVAENPNFLGVFRWNILRTDS
jgi:uncharacterized protein YfaT (DUF1175 family)